MPFDFLQPAWKNDDALIYLGISFFRVSNRERALDPEAPEAFDVHKKDMVLALAPVFLPACTCPSALMHSSTSSLDKISSRPTCTCVCIPELYVCLNFALWVRLCMQPSDLDQNICLHATYSSKSLFPTIVANGLKYSPR